MGQSVRDITEDQNADCASLCRPGSFLFGEKKDERAGTELSLRKMRERGREAGRWRKRDLQRERERGSKGGKRRSRAKGDIFASLVK